jgi:hypothetical protein
MDVRSYLASTRFAVVATAIAVAIPANYLAFALTGDESIAFLGMFTLGVSVPQVYGTGWPDEYDRPMGVAWTVAACALVFGALVVVFRVAELVLGGLGAAIAAFLLVQVAISGTSRALEGDDGLALRAGTDADADEDAVARPGDATAPAEEAPAPTEDAGAPGDDADVDGES